MGPPGICAIVGKSQRTIAQNVIPLLEFLVGSDMRYKAGSGEIDLFRRKIFVIGANDDRAEGRIRGATFSCALVDEATLIPETVFLTLLNRLSVEGAQLFATTNPDSPFHWLKTKFIDRKDELDLAYWSFFLDDNPSLAKAYVKSTKKENTGLWYKRNIAGQWEMAEGVVFQEFDKKIHVIKEIPGLAQEYYVGCDYGTTNPTSFILLAYNPSFYPNMWVEKEYYWDSKKMGKQKTDSQYAEDLKSFIGNLPVESIYLDPSAASFKNELRECNIQPPVLNSSNEVLDGIRRVSTLLSEGTLKIYEGCHNLLREFTLYTWDESFQKKGIDRPRKGYDHALDALRYIISSRFAYEVKPIRKEKQEDFFKNPMDTFFHGR